MKISIACSLADLELRNSSLLLTGHVPNALKATGAVLHTIWDVRIETVDAPAGPSQMSSAF